MEIAVNEQALLALLDAVEECEMRSLAWGFVDGSLSKEEVLALGSQVCPDEDAEEILVGLLDARLMQEVLGSDGTVRFRSRFAETTRLLVRLRQLFPKKPWFIAPHLVSDFRVDRRARRFPLRDIGPPQALSDLLSAGITLSPLQVKGWESVTSGMNLAAFQYRAVARILTARGNSGTIITAGTGSGKTLAFYLPALLRLIPYVDRELHWVKAIAIYPRTELLKDQFAETFRMARALDEVLVSTGKRPLIIGALFGDTPINPKDAQEKWAKRLASPAGVVCPFMRCSVCSGELIWTNEDIAASRELLVCSSSTCYGKTSSKQLLLTRESLQKTPPDILFTTIEMLNRRLSHPPMARSLFGVGSGIQRSRKPLMVLLDEVHTYVGTTGAQAALTLRRYRHALGTDLHFSGLSATLAEAERFFSDLTGLPVGSVVEVTPSSPEMTEAGAQYQILLRGDASSQASLLSTTIQAIMLLARTLDPPNGHSAGQFGERLFVFTDNLDVINRLFDDFRDAEAYDIFGRPETKRLPLAYERRDGPDALARDRDGQRWKLCEDIGRPLDVRLKVGRTTSQDTGVNATADVIVATASLEVGYNDARVGAVLQHKAPRNPAQFIQRKGRAGRSQRMRPYTLTVLSDYGIDRVAFQAFEHLFDPGLPPQSLPIANDYVLRMQAAYSLLDWLATRMPRGTRAWMWDILSRPNPRYTTEVTICVQQLQSLLSEQPDALQSLRAWLCGSLQVSADVADTILWEPPRSLLFEVVPTLLRRIERDWKKADGSGNDVMIPWHPVPDFVPQMTFGELNVPEVQILLPPATVRDQERTESLGINQVFSTLVPGNITRRFATERGRLRHWYPVALDSNEQRIAITDYCEPEYLGMFGDDSPIPVFRPWKIRLSKDIPQDVSTSSNASLLWRSEILSQGVPLVVDVPRMSAWRPLIENVSFYLHRFRSSVRVRRFAGEARAEIRRRSGERSVQIMFESEGQPAALGYEFDTDGLAIDIRLPSPSDLKERVLPPRLLRSCKAAYFRYLVLSDQQLSGDVNLFQRDWLCQVLIAAGAEVAIRSGNKIGASIAEVLSDPASIEQAMFAIVTQSFTGTQSHDDDERDEDNNQGDLTLRTNHPSRLQQKLDALVHQDEVRQRIGAIARELDEPDARMWQSWLYATLLETLGEALLQACITVAPRNAAIDSLVLDIDRQESGARIWITESTIGGGGVVQSFADVFSEDPRALFRAIEAALAPTDLEVAADGIERFIELINRDGDLTARVQSVRATESHDERYNRKRLLVNDLSRLGIDVPRALSVSLDARILTPGSGPDLDKALLAILNYWNECEEETGIALSPREIVFLLSKNDRIATAVRKLIARTLPMVRESEVDIVQALGGLLWPRGVEVRQRSLQSYSPFRRRRLTDPALVRALLIDATVPEVDTRNANWQNETSRLLSQNGAVRLCDPDGNETNLGAALLVMSTTPIEVGFLRLFPGVEKVEREGRGLFATVLLRECL